MQCNVSSSIIMNDYAGSSTSPQTRQCQHWRNNFCVDAVMRILFFLRWYGDGDEMETGVSNSFALAFCTWQMKINGI